MRTPNGGDPLEVLEKIHAILDGPGEWSADHLEWIATAMTGAGYEIHDPNDPFERDWCEKCQTETVTTDVETTWRPPNARHHWNEPPDVNDIDIVVDGCFVCGTPRPFEDNY
jgi:hypothetical protein